jgi:hypothetical protein
VNNCVFDRELYLQKTTSAMSTDLAEHEARGGLDAKELPIAGLDRVFIPITNLIKTKLYQYINRDLARLGVSLNMQSTCSKKLRHSLHRLTS